MSCSDSLRCRWLTSTFMGTSHGHNSTSTVFTWMCSRPMSSVGLEHFVGLPWPSPGHSRGHEFPDADGFAGSRLDTWLLLRSSQRLFLESPFFFRDVSSLRAISSVAHSPGRRQKI